MLLLYAGLSAIGKFVSWYWTLHVPVFAYEFGTFGRHTPTVSLRNFTNQTLVVSEKSRANRLSTCCSCAWCRYVHRYREPFAQEAMNDAAAFCKRGEWAKCCKELAATELWSKVQSADPPKRQARCDRLCVMVMQVCTKWKPKGQRGSAEQKSWNSMVKNTRPKPSRR